MTGTRRINRIAPLVLLALALAAGAASVRLAHLVAPSFPFVDQINGPTAPQGAAPAPVPVRNVESPATEPASAPALNSAPLVTPESPANAEPAFVGSEIGSPSTLNAPAEPAPTNIYPVMPSRFADGEPTIGPARPRVAPAQTSPKQPQRPGTGN